MLQENEYIEAADEIASLAAELQDAAERLRSAFRYDALVIGPRCCEAAEYIAGRTLPEARDAIARARRRLEPDDDES
jgi:hypothetical protein